MGVQTITMNQMTCMIKVSIVFVQEAFCRGGSAYYSKTLVGSCTIKSMYVLCFNFILGSNFIFFSFWVW